MRRRIACLALSALSFPLLACERPDTPADLAWLRQEVGDGALVHHADGRIYLTELSSGETLHVGNGNQPEFSPDGSRFAWIDGRTAKGRLRRGDPTLHVIARDVEASGGVHWISNRELVLIRRVGAAKPAWFRVSVDGEMREVPELTALGSCGYECDVKLGEDGVWSYVTQTSWATSDGGRGSVSGTCSVSLSPDGRSVTSLEKGHRKLYIESIRPGGASGTIDWPYKGSFDNHRFASNNPDYVVAVDEIDKESLKLTYPIIMRADGSRATRVATTGFAERLVYGDFVVGPGASEGWLAGGAPGHDHGG